MVIDMSAMNRILKWDPASGEIVVEPGVTIQQLWQRVEPEGWWPPVVSGTMFTTLGGCLAANVHGKNNFRVGPIGEHVLEFTALLPTGAQLTCSPKKNGDLFYGMISGLGMLGIFSSITMQMKRIHSGLLEVSARPSHNLHEHLADLEENAPASDYIVGWLDVTARGGALGRGQIHAARYLHEGEDAGASQTMLLKAEPLSQRITGLQGTRWWPSGSGRNCRAACSTRGASSARPTCISTRPSCGRSMRAPGPRSPTSPGRRGCSSSRRRRRW